jgi:3-methyl-2-oxobutanoate hydroxymethyltransferase
MKKQTVSSLWSKKNNEKIVCLTAYDYTSAKILDNAGVDMILVGDSLGMVMQGGIDTLSVTVDEMINHAKMVTRGAKQAFLIVDMPFGSYCTVEDGIKNAVRIIKESGADAVKLEGADPVIFEIIEKLLVRGVNVMGHIGLQPQMVNVMGGFKVQGRSNADKLKEEALALEKSGAIMVVLEGMLSECAADITQAVGIPTIGIGAGVHCDGQVLVYHDIFGLYADMSPKFVKRYVDLSKLIDEATRKYINDVRLSAFPADEHSYLR